MIKLPKTLKMARIIFVLMLIGAVDMRHEFERPSRIVTLKQGRVQGKLRDLPLQQTSSGGDDSDETYSRQVEVFRGIPFAAAPEGSLRFMPPVTVTPWRNVRKAVDFAPVCPQQLPQIRNESAALQLMGQGRLRALQQIIPKLKNQSEDCLYLNVYAPIKGNIGRGRGTTSTNDNEKKRSRNNPVILFIHGDSYEWGSGNIYDGSVLAAVGRVVVVTLNYRLGILGFLNANTDGKSRGNPSNLGILDQIAALHWVQENIEHFGGDPRNVTIMGHGTGAACVHFLMTSEALPLGMLFHRVILMSGSALSPWAVVQNPTRTTMQVAAAFNCSLSNSWSRGPNNLVVGSSSGGSRTLLQCLRSVPLHRLMRFRPESSSPFRPVWGPSYDGVVVHSFRHRMRDYLERMARYDLVLGVATADSLVFGLSDKQLEYGVELEGRNQIISEFVAANYELHQREIFSAIVTEYTDWQSPTQHPASIRDKTLEALNDAQYVAPLVEVGDFHSSVNAKSWLYVFDYQTKNSFYKQRQGCVHGEELNYVFGLPLLASQPDDKTSNVNFTRSEAMLSRIVIHFWSNFASTGDPHLSRIRTTSGETRITRNKNLQWDQYDPKYKKYLLIGLKPKMKDHYKSQKMALWLNLVPDLQAAAVAKSRQSEDHEREKTEQHVDDSDKNLLDYRLYSELLPFVPNIKNLESRALGGSTPASSEVLDHGRSKNVSNGAGNYQLSSSSSATNKHKNSSYISHESTALTNYSTALSVTIAIGCSLLVLNILIFTAVYYQRDRNRNHSDTGSTGSNRRPSSKLDNSPSNTDVSSIIQCKQLGDQSRMDHHGSNEGIPLHMNTRLQISSRGMSSISQYIERRPSDPNCIREIAEGHNVAGCSINEGYNMRSSSSSSIRRSLPDNDVPVQHLSVGNSSNREELQLRQQSTNPNSSGGNMPPLPRKSALKHNNSSGNMASASGPLVHKQTSCSGGARCSVPTSSFHAHLPPPEFADLPSPPPSISNIGHDHGGVHSRSSSHEMVGIGSSSDNQPLIMPSSSSRDGVQRDTSSSSFRTLPRQLRTTASGTTICQPSSQHPLHAHHNPISVPPHLSDSTQPVNNPLGPGSNQPHHQTLPLKSNLKKTSTGGNVNSGSGGNTNAQKLQWNQSTTSRSSLEELRV